MIIRMWHGRVSHKDGLAYRDFLKQRAIPDYQSIDGNIDVRILERVEDDAVHFITMTSWESMEAIKSFAGGDPERAKYYPEDQQYLLEFEPSVVHYEVVGRS
jgi:heme-degrading monooxygenase HmoA